MLYPIQNDVRNMLELSGIWDFQIDPEGIGEAKGWTKELPDPRPMAVPGSWNEQYADLYNYLDLAWYVKETYIPNQWQGQRIFIRLGSANYFGTVYVNGQKVGEHEGGYLPFALEITDLVNWNAANVIAISVENRLEPTRVPSGNMGGGMEAASIMNGYPSTTFDFYPFAGLHRPIVLLSLPQDAIEDITVKTGFSGTEGTVWVEVLANGPDGKGQAVLTGENGVYSGDLVFQDGKASVEITVPDVHLWSDKDPYLYELTVTTESDKYAMPVGIRTVEVKGKQILLNGEPVELKGFGRHEDFYASGKGLNFPLLVKDYQLMKWVGANSYRTSHYPYSEEEMMLADREGFLIIDETPAVSLQFDNEENIAERHRMVNQQIDELIARDKNHPSVVIWCVANEPMPSSIMARFSGGEGGGALSPMDQKGKEFLEDLMDHARALDDTRPVTFVSVMAGPPEWLEKCDVVCMNRYWGWYFKGGEIEKGLAMLDQELDDTWELFGRPIIMTEFGADTVAGLHGQPGLMWTEEYQYNFIKGYLDIAAQKDFVAGMQIWNFADFAAIQSPMRVGGMNLKGVFTRDRKPKMVAHLLREVWTKSKVKEPNKTNEEQALPDDIGLAQLLAGLTKRLKGKDLGTKTLKFNIKDGSTFLLKLDNGKAELVEGDGEADVTLILKEKDAIRLFMGKLDPTVAMMTGKIKAKGDIRSLMALQEAF
jgi:beta-glucuronidase